MPSTSCGLVILPRIHVLGLVAQDPPPYAGRGLDEAGLTIAFVIRQEVPKPVREDEMENVEQQLLPELKMGRVLDADDLGYFLTAAPRTQNGTGTGRRRPGIFFNSCSPNSKWDGYWTQATWDIFHPREQHRKQLSEHPLSTVNKTAETVTRPCIPARDEDRHIPEPPLQEPRP